MTPEERLAELLRREAAGSPAHETDDNGGGLASIRRRARRLRRRRTVGRVGLPLVAVAVAVAVLVPLVSAGPPARQNVISVGLSPGGSQGEDLLVARTGGTLAVVSPRGGLLREIPGPPGAHISWLSSSPAGTVAYMTVAPDPGSACSDHKILRVDLADGSETTVGAGLAPALDPTGTRLAYVKVTGCPGDASVTGALMIRDLTGGADTSFPLPPIHPVSGTAGVLGVSWSPDGRHLAVSLSGSDALFLADSAPSALTPGRLAKGASGAYLANGDLAVVRPVACGTGSCPKPPTLSFYDPATLARPGAVLDAQGRSPMTLPARETPYWLVAGRQTDDLAYLSGSDLAVRSGDRFEQIAGQMTAAAWVPAAAARAPSSPPVASSTTSPGTGNAASPAPTVARAPAPPPAVHPMPPVPMGSLPVVGNSTLAFTDAEHGWVVVTEQPSGPPATETSSILATVDGGRTWSTSLPTGAAAVTGIDFADGSHGWAVAGASGSNGSGRPTIDAAALLRTSDGGLSWHQIGEPPSPLGEVDFLDANRGWGVTVDDRVVSTSDGGVTWHAAAITPSVSSVCASADGLEWAATPGLPPSNGTPEVLESADGGTSWTVSFRGGPGWGAQVADVRCTGTTAWTVFDLSPGAGQQAAVVERTSDGGAHWVAVLRPPGQQGSEVPTAALNHAGPFSVVDAGSARFSESCSPCSVPQDSVVLTDDGGRSYSTAGLPGSGASAPGLVFLDADHGFASTATAPDATGRTSGVEVLDTTDGGRSWHVLFIYG